MANAIQPNLGKVYLLKNGEVKDPLGLNNFNAVSNINMLLVHIEDGESTNFVTINYLPNKMNNWTSNDFPLFFKGMVDHTLTGEAHPRRFAQYVTYVPPQIASMNINGQSPMNVGVTVKQTAGTRLLGAFTDLQSLINQYTPNEILRDENYVAYVMATEEIGYYMVEYNVVTSTYEWKLNTSGTYAGEVFIRGYNMFNITIQRSGNNPKPNGTISDLQLNMIWQQLNILGGRISFLEDNLIQYINIIGTDTIYESIANIQNNIADITINVRVAEPAFGENLIEITGDGLLVDETKIINLVGGILDVTDTPTLELIKEVDIDGNIDIRGNVILDSSVDNLLESNANGLLVDKNNVEQFVADRITLIDTPLNDSIIEVITNQVNPVVDVTLNNTTYVMTFFLQDGTNKQFDLPVESMIIDVTYDSANKDLIFTLQNGTVLVVPLDDLVSGLVSEAPIDGKTYARKNGVWIELTSTYQLPIMNETTLGGGKAITKTDEDTQVAVDIDGKLWYKKGGDGGVKTVNDIEPDENGNVELSKANIGLANVDNTSDVNKPVSTAQQNALNLKVNIAGDVTITGIKNFTGTLLYQGEEVATIEDLSTVFKYMGSVATYANLPTTNRRIGDVWNVIDTGKNFAWSGTAWDDLGGIVDLSNYYTKVQIDDLLNGKLDKINYTSTYPQVYFKEANGTQGMRDFSALATPNAIVQRNALGQIIGVDATAANQLATKGQMDTLIANNGKGIFIAEYGVTSYAEITAAVAAGKLPVAKDGVMYYTYVYSYDLEVPPTHMFFTFYDNTIQVIKTTVGVSWSQTLIPIEITANKTTVLNASSTNVQYAGAKVVYDELVKKLDKVSGVTTNKQTYTKNVDGTQEMVDATYLPTQNTYALRTTNGRLKVGTAVDNDEAVTKLQLTNDLATKQATLTNVTSAEIVTGTDTTQKSVTAKALNEAINLIMFNSLGGSS